MTWQKLEIDTMKQKKDLFIECQTHIREGTFKCDFNQIGSTILTPILNGTVKGEAWLLEETNPVLTLIFGVRYIHHLEKWMMVACMSHPFSDTNFMHILDLVGDKIKNFMNEKKITHMLGSYLILYKFEDSIYANYKVDEKTGKTTGYTQEEFISTITSEFAKKRIEYSYDENERMFHIKLQQKDISLCKQ